MHTHHAHNVTTHTCTHTYHTHAHTHAHTHITHITCTSHTHYTHHTSHTSQMRKNIPCHLIDVSCGHTCDRPLPCQHKCQRLCHKGECLGTGEVCQQPCTSPRKLCQHPCGSPCHPGSPCPDELCWAKIVLKCPCGRKKESGHCQKVFQA